ncbi:MAG TPA: hypothetical protein VF593_05055, partial [Chthoniobacteraceae bacterium]
EKEEAARKSFNDTTAAMVVLAEFDRLTALTPEQFARLELALGKVMTDFGPEITSAFSSSSTTPWYLQYYRLLPIVGVPEPELKAMLSKEQMERWTSSSEYSNSSGLWTNIQETQVERLKIKK